MDAFCLLRCYYSRQPEVKKRFSNFLNLKNLTFGLFRIFRLIKNLGFLQLLCTPLGETGWINNNKHDNGSKPGITLTKKY